MHPANVHARPTRLERPHSLKHLLGRLRLGFFGYVVRERIQFADLRRSGECRDVPGKKNLAVYSSFRGGGAPLHDRNEAARGLFPESLWIKPRRNPFD